MRNMFPSKLKTTRLMMLCAAAWFISVPTLAQDQVTPPVAAEALVEAPPEQAAPVEAAAPAAAAEAPAATPAPGTPATAAASNPAAPKHTERPKDELLGKKIVGLNPNDIPSLVFTYWEHAAIRDARRARGLVRAPTGEELANDMNADPEDLSVKPPPDQRDISLGGIAYVSAGDWTIWLNGERITPKALPEEALDLKVFNEYIEVKWYDKYTNQIFPIRLRPHQRFNIDTRIFLPG